MVSRANLRVVEMAGGLCRIFGGLAVLAPLFIAGCAVGPDYVPPETEMPDQWASAVVEELADEEPDLEQWWTAFNDPQLSELIDRATESNKNLQVAVIRVTEARALRGIANADFFPQLGAGGSYSRSQSSENTALGSSLPGGSDPVDNWNLGFDAAWEIDVFGRVQRSVESAEADIEASIEDYRDVLVSLYAEVAVNYVEIRSLQARLDYARANVVSQTESVSITRDRFSAGLTSALDVAQAEGNLASTESSIPSLEMSLVAALNRLAVLLGENPGALNEELQTVREIPEASVEIAMGMPAELLRRRPDVRRAERLLAAQTARIGVATADLYPSFSLPGFLGLESEDLGDLFSGESLTWNLSPGFQWKIFSAGKIRNRIKVEEARTEQALLRYEQSILLALEEVENAMVAYDRERVRRDHLSDSVDASQRSVEMVRTQYTSGLTNFQNVLDSQRSLFNRQDELASSEGRVVQNLIALNKALGGGWSLDAPAPDEELASTEPEAKLVDDTLPAEAVAGK